MKRERLRTGRSLVFSVAGLFCLAAPAGAVMIGLSSHTSDGSVSASLLAATLDFQVVDSRVTLTASNASGFDIGSIYFNARPAVTGLAPKKLPDGWFLMTGAADTTAAGFGTFDYVLTAEIGLFAGDSASFRLDISGTSPWGGLDFATNGSSGGYAAAAKFRAASEVFGASHAPEPTTALLLGMGLVGIALRARAGPDTRG